MLGGGVACVEGCEACEEGVWQVGWGVACGEGAWQMGSEC